MAEYRFHLEKYRTGSKGTCPSCGRHNCFVHYVDSEGKIIFPDNVGLCDHVNTCGYHYTPKNYFSDNPSEKPLESWGTMNTTTANRAIEKKEPSFISSSVMQSTLTSFGLNPLFLFLKERFGEQETRRLFGMYNVGTAKLWGGSTIFWQVDVHGKVRSGKVMAYDAKTGHRVKDDGVHVCWAHSLLKQEKFNLCQCLFGEHLLASMPDAQVILVESEKTAIIASHFIPQYVWLATGGMQGCFKKECLSVLRNRDVVLMPDLGAWNVWNKKALLLKDICHSVHMSDILEQRATEEQRAAGLDIADFLLMEETKQQILQRMIQRNPALQLLIDALDLELVEDD